MALLTPAERRTLAAICDTLIPVTDNTTPHAAINQYHAASHRLVERVVAVLERSLSAHDQQALKAFLQALEIGAVNGILSGRWRGFSHLSASERERILADWGNSRIFQRRKAFQGIKQMVLFVAYGNLPGGEPHPIWEAIGYEGPPGAGEKVSKPIQPHDISDHHTITTEVLVIGSGAGGGVVAGELSAAGYEVMVVEKGRYHDEADFTGDEREASASLYEQQAMLTTADTAMLILAGATLGGGTTVNWSASLRTPDHVLREWAHEYGIAAATTPAWQHSLDAVTQRSHVDCDESHLNPNNALLEKGCLALGYHMDVIPRNVNGCVDCTFCGYGCIFGAKQGTMKTYLQDAYRQGSKIVVNARALRILHERGTVSGAVIEVTDKNGHLKLVTVRAKVVVVSAGSIHTPALLKRSSLRNPNIGQHLHLHPATTIFSIFDEPVRMWHGVPMSRISKEFSNLDGRGYGVALEVAPAHPGLSTAISPWQSARQHKRLLAQMAYTANGLAITRDYHGGRVRVDKRGDPVLDYRLHPYDARHLQRGILELMKIHHAAGARQIFAPHNALLRFDNEGDDSRFVRFLRTVEDAGLAPHAFPLFSAHQMSSARMAGSPRQGVLKPTGETWEVNNLFVADGSAMPTATGVNPMISIMGTAHYIAQHIKAALH